MMGENVPWSRRATSAAASLVMNVIMWIVIPWYLAAILSQTSSAYPFMGLDFVVAFGAVIAGLHYLGALTRGMSISVPFVSGANVAVAFYLWEAFGGGTMGIEASGISFVLSMKTLLFLMMLPFLFNAARAPVEFLLEHGEASRPAADVPGLA